MSPHKFPWLLATDKVMLFVRVILPELPVTVSGYVPTVMDGWVVTVKTVLAVGVSGFVANVAVASAGSPRSPNVTGELKPFTEVSCVVKVMD